MTLPDTEENCLQSPPSKRLKLDESTKSGASYSSGTTELLSFCDDLLLEVLSYLKPGDLLALSQCCQRLNRIACDRTLWEKVDFRSEELTDSELRKFVKFFLPSTKSIATKGTWKPQPIPAWDGEVNLRTFLSERDVTPQNVTPTVTVEFLKGIADKAPNLFSLTLENHVLDSEDVKNNVVWPMFNGYHVWEKLPSQIEHLTLQCCHLTKCTRTDNTSDQCSESFFTGICDCLPLIKKLDLTGCQWFNAHSLFALSKCQQLEELRLTDCLLHEFVPYISLSARFGFKCLRVVDLRRTWVSDREISCLDKTPTLQELYLEAPRDEMGRKLVTDLGVTAFGGTFGEWQEMGYIVIHFDGHNAEGVIPSPLKVLELCNYVSVSDTSLRHCASCLKGLERLNVKGTSCTQAGVIRFKSQRPSVIIESDFHLEVEAESESIEGNLAVS